MYVCGEYFDVPFTGRAGARVVGHKTIKINFKNMMSHKLDDGPKRDV